MLSNEKKRMKRLCSNANGRLATNNNVDLSCYGSASVTPESVTKALAKPFRTQFDILVVKFTEDYNHCTTCGIRPAICISSTELNKRGPLLTVIPMTKSMQYVDKFTHVFIDYKDCEGLEASGVAMAEQPHCIDRTQAIKKIGKITDVNLQKKVMKAVKNALGMEVQ